MKRFHTLSILLVAALALGACAPAATPEPTTTPAGVQRTEPPPTAEPKPQTIVDIATADGRFTTLVSALEAADLVETLQGDGKFTVFAPTDEAFAKLPAGTLDGLLADVPQLKNILLYHVVSGEVMAADVVQLSSAETALGETVNIKVEGDKVFVNEAQVVITDIQADNGVIHVIDTVLAPPTG